MSLDINCDRDENVFIVHASGDMDFHNFRILRTTVEEALIEGERKFVLDLSKIIYLDSSALGSLLYSQKKIREQRGSLAIISSDALADILKLTHLDSYFHIVDSVDEGNQWVKTSAPSASQE